MDVKEKELVLRVLSGDTAAFEPLVLPYRQTLFGLAFKMTDNREDALEVSQEALLRAFRYLGKCDLERGFRNWLLQILVNAARDLGGRKRAESESLASSFLFDGDAVLAAEPKPEDERGRSEIRGWIMETLSVLTGREREIFILRDLEEKSIRETAEITKSSTISVRVHLSRARGKIRERLAALDPTLERRLR